MKYFIPLFCVLILFSSCDSRKKVGVDEEIIKGLVYIEVKTKKELEAAKNENVKVFGTLIQENFVNKAGKSTGIQETLLKLSDGETVHLRNVGQNVYSYPDLINKKVELTGVVFYGAIDSDNPEHQSRIGYRINYSTLTILD